MNVHFRVPPRQAGLFFRIDTAEGRWLDADGTLAAEPPAAEALPPASEDGWVRLTREVPEPGDYFLSLHTAADDVLTLDMIGPAVVLAPERVIGLAVGR